jgi:hypothetical protein
VPRPPHRRRRRRRHTTAWLAVTAYAAFALVAVVLVARSLDGPALKAGDGTRAEEPTATTDGGAEQLALQTVGSRAQRSTVGVGRSTGFVAWETNGLTLVLTARPSGGWQTGERRSVPVRYGGRTYDGRLVRTDAAAGLGLVRVQDAGVAEALWPDGARTAVFAGDLVVLVGRSSATTAEVERAGPNRIYFARGGLASFAGAPVLDESGELVGVVDAGGGATPIGRACGVIRRC